MIFMQLFYSFPHAISSIFPDDISVHKRKVSHNHSTNKKIISSKSKTIINFDNDEKMQQFQLISIERLSLKEGNQTIKKGKKSRNSHDSNRIDEITENFYRFYKNFPFEISEMIMDYDHDHSLGTLYNSVMNQLNVSQIYRKNLDFYNENFMERFKSFLSINGVNLKSFTSSIFFDDLTRLAFKWLIHARQNTFNNENLFMIASKSLDSFRNLICLGGGHLNIPIDFNFEYMKPNILLEFMHLIRAEFLENSHFLFSPFASSIRTFYENLKGKEGDNYEIACEMLKNDYFNGNFNQNLLFKYLIVIYDPNGRMRECITRDDPHSKFLKVYPIEMPIQEEDFKNLQCKGPETLELTKMSYISKCIIDFWLSSNQRISMDQNPSDLVHLLVEMGKRNLLTRDSIKGIIGFQSKNKLFDWSLENFKEYLNHFMEYFQISKDKLEFIEYSLKLFE